MTLDAVLSPVLRHPRLLRQPALRLSGAIIPLPLMQKQKPNYTVLVMVRSNHKVVTVEAVDKRDGLDNVATCVSINGYKIANHQIVYGSSGTTFKLHMQRSRDCAKITKRTVAELVYLRSQGMALCIAPVKAWT